MSVDRPDSARGQARAHQAANRAAILDAARDVFADIGYGAASVRDIVRAHRPGDGHVLQLLPRQGVGARARCWTRRRRRRARACAPRGAAATTLEAFVRDGFRAYFDFLLEDRGDLELLRRNAGTIRAMFDEPSLGRGRRGAAPRTCGRASQPG